MKKITSLQNPYIKYLINLREKKSFRNEHKEILVTNKNVIYELVKDFKILSLITTHNKIENFKEVSCENIFIVSENILKKITNLKTPDGFCATIKMPEKGVLEKSRKILIFDKISDPQNAGTLLRSALAFNFDLAVFLKSSIDPFHEKLIRASKGAIFRLPILENTQDEIIKDLKDFEIYLADISGENFETVLYKKPLALILSNESKGPSDIFKNIAKKITIKISKETESLNVAVAGSIIMQKIKNV